MARLTSGRHYLVLAALLTYATFGVCALKKPELVFKSLDTNNDGCLTDEELSQNIKRTEASKSLQGSTKQPQLNSNEPLKNPELDRTIASMDTDGDGRVCWCDFLKKLRENKSQVDHVPSYSVLNLLPSPMAFHHLDKDKDGFINKDGETKGLAKVLRACMSQELVDKFLDVASKIVLDDNKISSAEYYSYLAGL